MKPTKRDLIIAVAAFVIGMFFYQITGYLAGVVQ